MSADPKPAYRLTHVTDSTGYDATRGAHRTKQVHYVLADGTKSYIEHPIDQHTPEHVAEAMYDVVANHDGIMQLQGPPQMSGMTPPINPWGSGQ